MKLWVDDERPAPEGWAGAKTYQEAIDLLLIEKVEELSLDHDLADFSSDGREKTGYDVALWLVQRKLDGQSIPAQISCHSANPIGRERILGVVDRYLR